MGLSRLGLGLDRIGTSSVCTRPVCVRVYIITKTNSFSVIFSTQTSPKVVIFYFIFIISLFITIKILTKKITIIITTNRFMHN